MSGRAIIVAGVLGILLLGVTLAAFLPLRTSRLGSRPHPLPDYDAAVAAAIRRQRADDILAAAGGRSLLLLHGHRTAHVSVLLHGYTNSPAQFAVLARQLYETGDNVYVPRLPHHAERGSKSSALAEVTAENLRSAADSAIDIARGLGDSIVVLGLSAGGTMAVWIAQYRQDVLRVVVVAPLIALARVPRVADEILQNLAVRLPNFTYPHRADAREPDRELGWSTRGVGQILLLGLAARRAAELIAPAVHDVRFLLNAHDHTISAAPVLDLGALWAAHGAAVHAYELPDSLGLPHDVIDPRQRVQRPEIVYPALIALLHGETPSLSAPRTQ